MYGTHVRAAQTTKILHHIINRACLADEIAEPRPDMNIKVTAFTESKKFKYIGAKALLKYLVPMACLVNLTPQITYLLVHT